MENGLTLNSCFDCIWRSGDECHNYHNLDENGNPDPIHDEPTDCVYFAEE